MKKLSVICTFLLVSSLIASQTLAIQYCKDVLEEGNPGVGKTFLSKCIAYAATQATVKVLFTTAMDMINHLVAAEADHSLLKKLHYYQSPDLLVIDEIVFFRLANRDQISSSRLSVHGMKKNLP